MERFCKIYKAIKWLALIISLCFCTIALSQSNTKLDKYFNKKMKRANIIGMQVGYINDGNEWNRSYGVKSYRTQKRVNDSTLFMIASCSKPVTALAVLKLYDQGKIDLDDNINNYLTRTKIYPKEKNSKPITFFVLHTNL